MKCVLRLLLLTMLVLSGGCARIKSLPEQPGLYVLTDAGQVERLSPLTRSPRTQDELQEMIGENAIVSVSPSTRFLLFEPKATVDDVRSGFWMNIHFTYFDPGPTGGYLGPKIRAVSRRKRIWELSFPQLAAMRSGILTISWEPKGESDRKCRAAVWVEGLSPGRVSKPPSLFDSANYMERMISSIAAEQTYSFGKEVNLKIPREKAVRLSCSGDHPSNVTELVIYPCGERLYILCAWPSQCCPAASELISKRPICEELSMHSQTSQPELNQRAHWTTAGPNHKLGIGTMWDYNRRFVKLRLRTRTMKGFPR